MAILIALILTFSMTASIMLIPSASAHSPPWDIVSYAYLTVAPNPVGLGQQIAVYMWVDHPLPGESEIPGTAVGDNNNVRRMGFELTITAPNGQVTKQTFAVVSDPTGIQMYYMTPDQVGNYTFQFYYPGQYYVWNSTNSPTLSSANNIYYGDWFTSSLTRPLTITVGQTQAPSPPTPALPTAYWTYPIFGENYNWYTIASNWLAGPYMPASAHSGNVQPFGAAPNTDHIMWTNPIQYGGVVGGNDTVVPGELYYQGGSYNTRFASAIIMQGTLFFALPYGNAGTGGNYVAWDLKTGQQLWSINTTATGVSLVPSFGYLPSMDQPNQHGILPNGLLIATTSAYAGDGTVWRGYDPMTGVLTTMMIENVPGGTAVAGPQGEYLKINLVNYGTTANPNYYLQEWNSSKVFGIYAGTGTSDWYTGTLNANVPITPAMPTSTPPTGQAWNWNGTGWQLTTTSLAVNTLPSYDWNVSVSLPMTPNDSSWAFGGVPTGPTQYSPHTSASGTVALNDLALIIQGSFGGHVDAMGAAVATGPANVTAISLDPATLGKTLWIQSYQPAPGNNTRVLAAWDPSTGVFIIWDQESMDQLGFSLKTGNLIWGPVNVPNGTATDWNYMGDGTTQENVAYGNIYWAGYSGLLYCINDSTGVLEWTFGNGAAADNSTFAGEGTPYGYYPIFVSDIADGMVYLSSTEHSPNSPLYYNYDERCINATTGLQIWAIPCFGNLMYSAYAPLASGYLVCDNTYTQSLYCFGQGPSATTVTAPDTATCVGTPVVIRGTVTDISAGTQQAQQKADFPNGVPCVSDASESAWMQYVYEQQPMPNDVTGVPVTISVIDSNGNYRTIGTTTTDSSGMFTLAWAPDISGSYTVIATFAGSNAYYPSNAETSFYATAAPASTAAPTATPLSIANTYFVPAIAGLFIVIIVGLAIVTLLMLRKHP